MGTRTRKRGGRRRRRTSPGRTTKSAGRRAGSSVAWKLAGLPLDHEPACMGAQVAVAGLSAISATPLPSADRSVSRSGETPLPRYPATSPAENGARYFPIILMVTSSNQGIQDLVEPAGIPVFFPFYKRYRPVTATRPGTIPAIPLHAAFFGGGSPPENETERAKVPMASASNRSHGGETL